MRINYHNNRLFLETNGYHGDLRSVETMQTRRYSQIRFFFFVDMQIMPLKTSKYLNKGIVTVTPRSYWKHAQPIFLLLLFSLFFFCVCLFLHFVVQLA